MGSWPIRFRPPSNTSLLIGHQIDQRLASIMQGKVSAVIRELITDDVAHIRLQNMTNQNSMTVPSERLDMQRLRTDERAARLYEGYCEIWRRSNCAGAGADRARRKEEARLSVR